MSPDGKQRFEHSVTGQNPVELGKEVSDVLKKQGADKIIEALNEEE